MKNQNKVSQFAVLGLGRFGLSIVQTLAEYDVNILACDNDAEKLHEVAELVTLAVQMDILEESALEKLGLGDYDVVILAMSEDFEASVMTAMIAKEQGAKYVMVKARNHRQKKILELIGVDRVILPEYEMGVKIARHLAEISMVDVMEESQKTVDE